MRHCPHALRFILVAVLLMGCAPAPTAATDVARISALPIRLNSFGIVPHLANQFLQAVPGSTAPARYHLWVTSFTPPASTRAPTPARPPTPRAYP